MSFQHGARCYDSAVEAWSALAAGQVGTIQSAGSAVYVIDVDSVGVGGIAYRLRDLLGGADVTYTAAPAMQACSLIDSADALQMSWMVAACWLAVVAVLFITRGLRNDA